MKRNETKRNETKRNETQAARRRPMAARARRPRAARRARLRPLWHRQRAASSPSSARRLARHSTLRCEKRLFGAVFMPKQKLNLRAIYQDRLGTNIEKRRFVQAPSPKSAMQDHVVVRKTKLTRPASGISSGCRLGCFVCPEPVLANRQRGAFAFFHPTGLLIIKLSVCLFVCLSVRLSIAQVLAMEEVEIDEEKCVLTLGSSMIAPCHARLFVLAACIGSSQSILARRVYLDWTQPERLGQCAQR